MISREKTTAVLGITMCEARMHLSKGDKVHVYAYGIHWGNVTGIVQLKHGHWYVCGDFGRFRPERYTRFLLVFDHNETRETGTPIES